MKRFSIVLALLLLVAFVLAPTKIWANEEILEIKVQVLGEKIELVPTPFMENDRVIVPLRDVAEACGAKLSWDGEKQSIVLSRADYLIEMVIGKGDAFVNGNKIKLDFAPSLLGDITMVPISFFAPGLGMDLSWDSLNRTVMVKEAGLRVGSSLDFPPFEFLDNDNKIKGFDIDIINAIGNEIGENMLIEYIDYDKLISTLMAGGIDVIISGMTIIEPRQEVIHFTEPYFEYGEVIIAKQEVDRPLVIEDLAGKSIAVQLGTTGQDLATKLQEETPQTQILKHLAWEEVLASVETGQVDLAIISHPTFSQYMLENDSKLQMASGLIASQPLGIAVQKGTQELLDSLNQGLAAIKDNGTYDEIYQKWFLSPGI